MKTFIVGHNLYLGPIKIESKNILIEGCVKPEEACITLIQNYITRQPNLSCRIVAVLTANDTAVNLHNKGVDVFKHIQRHG